MALGHSGADHDRNRAHRAGRADQVIDPNAGGARQKASSFANWNVESQPKSESSKGGLNAEPSIVVRTEGDNQQQFPAHKLIEAIQTAMGGHGWVELRNREPLHLADDQTLNFVSARGRLIMRAAAGFQPVIEIDLKNPRSFLTTGSGVSVELSGLTIKANYPQQHPSSTPPALIVAAGSAKIDRCAFEVTGGFHPKGSRNCLQWRSTRNQSKLVSRVRRDHRHHCHEQDPGASGRR